MNQLDANPLVYGYLCVDAPDENQVAAWTREITAFANKSGYRLGSIFIDSGDVAISLARGGFVELLTALRLPEAYAAVGAFTDAPCPPTHFSNRCWCTWCR